MCFHKGFRVILSCCGTVLNSAGESFYYIERFKTSANNRILSDKKTVDEIIYVATCTNCGHFIIKYRQKIKNKAGRKKLGITKYLKGKEADEFFYTNYSKMIEYPLESPYVQVKQNKTIPFVYGKVIDGNTQQPFYIDDSDMAGEMITSPVVSVR